MSSYSAAEVARLLSMTEEDAIAEAEDPGSSLGRLSKDGAPSGRESDAEQPVSLYARWSEVHDAARAVSATNAAERAARVADRLGGGQPTSGCSGAAACLRCGDRPRARQPAVRRRVRGGWEEIKPERLGSLCLECRDQASVRTVRHAA